MLLSVPDIRTPAPAEQLLVALQLRCEGHYSSE